MTNMEQFKEQMSMQVFGRSVSLAMAVSQCVSCGKPAAHFRDQLSLKEYGISGLCQRCQDEIFTEPMDDEA